MKRINLYIQPEQDEIITQLAMIENTDNKSDIIRKAIDKYIKENYKEDYNPMNYVKEINQSKSTKELFNKLFSIHSRDGIAQYVLTDKQERLYNKIMNNDKIIIKSKRQFGNTTLFIALSLLQILQYPNNNILYITPSKENIKEMISKVSLNISNRIVQYQHNIIKNNDNNSSILISTPNNVLKNTSGLSFNTIIIDNMDYINDEYINSINRLIDINSNKKTKIILSSTVNQNKLGEFFYIWLNAITKRNDYLPIYIPHDIDEDSYDNKQNRYSSQYMYDSEIRGIFTKLIGDEYAI
jgi:hypothetical protein